MSSVDPTTRIRQNARRYPAGDLATTDDDEMLNVSAACVDFDLNFWTFHRHTKKSLTSHRRTYRLPGEEGDGRSEETFLKSEISRLLAKPLAVENDGRYELPDGTVRLTFIRACKELGSRHIPIARETLDKFVADGLVVFEWWKSPLGHYREQTCSESDLASLKKHLREQQETNEREGSDGPQIRVRHAIKMLQPLWQKNRRRGGKLKAARFAVWAKNGCQKLGGDKITLYDGRTWMLKTDYEKLVKALSLGRGQYLIDGEIYGGVTAAARKGITGHKMGHLQDRDDVQVRRLQQRGCNGKARRVVPIEVIDRPPAYAPLFDGEYADGRVNLTRAEELSGLSRNFLKKCIKATAYLEVGKLPCVMQWPEGNKRYRANQENTVLPADLKRLKHGIEKATLQRAPNGFKDAHDIRELYQAEDLFVQIAVGALLKYGREHGEISAWRPDKPIATRGAQKRRTWFYDPKEALAYIRGTKAVLSSPATPPTNGTVPAPEKNNGQQEAPAIKRGAPKKSKTTEVQEYIYERWIKGDRVEAIWRGAVDKFPKSKGYNPPSDWSNITRDAKRFAKKFGKSTDRKKAENT
jgi:hypothetical protein